MSNNRATRTGNIDRALEGQTGGPSAARAQTWDWLRGTSLLLATRLWIKHFWSLHWTAYNPTMLTWNNRKMSKGTWKGVFILELFMIAEHLASGAFSSYNTSISIQCNTMQPIRKKGNILEILFHMWTHCFPKNLFGNVLGHQARWKL